jgi:hypothetical protein
LSRAPLGEAAVGRVGGITKTDYLIMEQVEKMSRLYQYKKFFL